MLPSVITSYSIHYTKLYDQDEVIRHIVNVLAVQLSTSEKERVGRPPTENLEAYDYYLRAEQAVRSGFRPNFRIALNLYNKATELDRVTSYNVCYTKLLRWS